MRTCRDRDIVRFGGSYFYKMSTKIFSQGACIPCSRSVCMEQRELRHDRHTVSILTDHTVFSPKYRGKILVEKTIALALDRIIRKTCKDLNIEIIDMAVNVDHIHFFIKYPPKYSVSYIKRIKGRSSRELPEGISTPRGMVRVLVSGHHLASMVRLVMGGGCARDTYKIRRI